MHIEEFQSDKKNLCPTNEVEDHPKQRTGFAGLKFCGCVVILYFCLRLDSYTTELKPCSALQGSNGQDSNFQWPKTSAKHRRRCRRVSRCGLCRGRPRENPQRPQEFVLRPSSPGTEYGSWDYPYRASLLFLHGALRC